MDWFCIAALALHTPVDDQDKIQYWFIFSFREIDIPHSLCNTPRKRPAMSGKSQGQKMKIHQNVNMSMSHHKKDSASVGSLPPLKYESLEEMTQMRLQVTRAVRRDSQSATDQYRWVRGEGGNNYFHLFLLRQVRTPYPFEKSAVSFPILECQKMQTRTALKTYHLPPIDKTTEPAQGGCHCLPGASAKFQ